MLWTKLKILVYLLHFLYFFYLTFRRGSLGEIVASCKGLCQDLELGRWLPRRREQRKEWMSVGLSPSFARKLFQSEKTQQNSHAVSLQFKELCCAFDAFSLIDESCFQILGGRQVSTCFSIQLFLYNFSSTGLLDNLHHCDISSMLASVKCF
jgi:hypothetical protein